MQIEKKIIMYTQNASTEKHLTGVQFFGLTIWFPPYKTALDPAHVINLFYYYVPTVNWMHN